MIASLFHNMLKNLQESANWQEGQIGFYISQAKLVSARHGSGGMAADFHDGYVGIERTWKTCFFFFMCIDILEHKAFISPN